MKAAPFNYHLADHLDHALELLDHLGDDIKLIAGGQSLVPMMAMRLAKPSHLVDINRIQSLQQISLQAKTLQTGSAVKQKDLEISDVSQAIPLFKQALPWIGHQQTRNRGTVGGSLAHADPSAELPLIATVLNASLHVQSHNCQREIRAQDFFLGPMWTSLNPQECLTHIHWPIWNKNFFGSSFLETSIRHGDFAMASAAAQINLNPDGTIQQLSFGVGGMGATPIAFPSLSQHLIGMHLSSEVMHELANQAILLTEPTSDLHASASYRMNLARTLLSRALLGAFEQAQQHPQ
jgi:carbon-monoxide dehydrogenase medium subunit/2-furoyl-CoA dehydrogenase FAD binding subunit